MLEMTARLMDNVRVEVTDGHHTAVFDEPKDEGGDGTGLRPVQGLLAALGACTAMTLRLYTRRKEWPLEDVIVRLKLDRPKSGPPRFIQEVELIGPLDEGQRERCRQIAGRCPVHRIIEGPVEFEELLAAAAPAGD